MKQNEDKLTFRKMASEEVAAVYEEHMRKDFPADELKPLAAIRYMIASGIYDCLGLYEGETLIAYGFFVTNRERGYELLDYLAVCGPYRGSGYGSRCLKEMKRFYGEENGVLLECESRRSANGEAERKERERRIHFYVKNGCVETGIMSLLFGVEYEILYFPLAGTAVDAAEELEGLYRKMFPDNIYEKKVRIWEEKERKGERNEKF